MKKSVILVTLTLALLAPSISHAAWWNPSTWFSKSVSQEAAVVEVAKPVNPQAATTEAEPISENQIALAPTIQVKEVLIDNPIHLEKIRALEKELANLKNSNKNYLSQVEELNGIKRILETDRNQFHDLYQEMARKNKDLASQIPTTTPEVVVGGSTPSYRAFFSHVRGRLNSDFGHLCRTFRDVVANNGEVTRYSGPAVPPDLRAECEDYKNRNNSGN